MRRDVARVHLSPLCGRVIVMERGIRARHRARHTNEPSGVPIQTKGVADGVRNVLLKVESWHDLLSEGICEVDITGI